MMKVSDTKLNRRVLSSVLCLFILSLYVPVCYAETSSQVYWPQLLDLTANPDKLSAQESIQQNLTVLSAAERNNDIISIAFAKLNIARSYIKLKDFKNAITFAKHSLLLYKKQKDNKNQAFTHQLLGIAFFESNDFTKADRHFIRSIRHASLVNDIYLQIKSYNYLAKTAELKEHYKEAYEYHKQYFFLKEKWENNQPQNQFSSLYSATYPDLHYALAIKKNNIADNKTNTILVIIIFVIFIVFLYVIKKFYYLLFFWRKKSYIGHYQIIEKIASGGISHIFLAIDIRNKSRIVALKVLKEEFYTSSVKMKRLINEAEIMDQLNHPNIIKVFERGFSGDKYYIAMEYVKGKTLAEILKTEKIIPLPVIIKIIRQILDALSAIHEKNIIHRDIKPPNIIITKWDSDNFQIKILDFNLAKSIDVSRITQTGKFVGTIYYLPPEQIENQPITAKADIYSLGILFYEMIAGEKPFKDNTSRAIFKKILKDTPVSLTEKLSDFPITINQLIMQMLSKKPENRPNLQEIKAILDDFSAANSINHNSSFA